MLVAYHLPEGKLTNERLIAESEGVRWTAETLEQKIGIRTRRIAGEESTLDMACAAASKLFKEHSIDPGEIDFVLLGTETGEYRAPSTACLIQSRLGIPQGAGALDFDLGCSAFVYGLSLAKGLLSAGMAQKVLLINSDTFTKMIAPDDFGLRSVIGDAATAVLLDKGDLPRIGEFVFGTDGSGAEDLIIRDDRAYMNGTAVYTFTLRVVPPMIDQVLAKNGLTKDDIDMFVLHQPNRLVLTALAQFLRVDPQKIAFDIEEIGNTSGCTIPISLARAGDLTGKTLLLAGFGIGLSWAATILRC